MIKQRVFVFGLGKVGLLVCSLLYYVSFGVTGFDSCHSELSYRLKLRR